MLNVMQHTILESVSSPIRIEFRMVGKTGLFSYTHTRYANCMAHTRSVHSYIIAGDFRMQSAGTGERLGSDNLSRLPEYHREQRHPHVHPILALSEVRCSGVRVELRAEKQGRIAPRHEGAFGCDCNFETRNLLGVNTPEISGIVDIAKRKASGH